ncbi:MAG: multiple resistance and pH regulation protein F [Rhodospirillales bacterium]|nr:MAG: multiple resistance and pH regulation protein F [Rhodospirillales bacterium]
MTAILYGLAAFLVANILLGLLRVARGPDLADRMVAAQLFGTMGVAILLLLAEAAATPGLTDAAVLFAVLGALALLAFVDRVWDRLAAGRQSEREP